MQLQDGTSCTQHLQAKTASEALKKNDMQLMSQKLTGYMQMKCCTIMAQVYNQASIHYRILRLYSIWLIYLFDASVV